ncbi:28c602ab-fc47-4589-97ff-9bacf0481d04 [Sclerotinia trifoliorum]|uniref:28c602ab-fc47-4589-97ff-9bacf0481d04 n=1 Tax=Sclerotinia trifoliorum TaxID=28548 RepID=A0A8H2W083_9HELO|nr:28c602ab-fc47-4589-97ff-9bacf0481d04 [Sclerotinia trifoliorum]
MEIVTYCEDDGCVWIARKVREGRRGRSLRTERNGRVCAGSKIELRAKL